MLWTKLYFEYIVQTLSLEQGITIFSFLALQMNFNELGTVKPH